MVKCGRIEENRLINKKKLYITSLTYFNIEMFTSKSVDSLQTKLTKPGY